MSWRRVAARVALVVGAGLSATTAPLWAETTTPVATLPLQAIQTPPLPPLTSFPMDRQLSTMLTQMILKTNKALRWEVAHWLAEAILHHSQAQGVDFRLIAGVLAVESSFRSDAVSPTGALGLGQLKPATAQWLGVANPFDPWDNIGGASRYLRFLLNRYNGDLDSAVAAYFQGQGTIDRHGINDSARVYLSRVNQMLSLF